MENKKFSIKTYLITIVISIIGLSLFLWLVGGAELTYFLDTKKVLINLGMSFGFSLFFVPLIVFSISNGKKNGKSWVKSKTISFIKYFIGLLVLQFICHKLFGMNFNLSTVGISLGIAISTTLIF